MVAVHVWLLGAARLGRRDVTASQRRWWQQHRIQEWAREKQLQALIISKCPKQPLPSSAPALLPGHPTKTPLLSDERGLGGGVKIFVLHHQQLINV